MNLSEIPDVSSNKAEKVLIRLGCEFAKGKGSHVRVYRFVDGQKKRAVFLRGRKQLPKTVLKDILIKLEITLDEFKENL